MKNRIVSYPKPSIVKKIEDLSKAKNISKSAVVHEAIRVYFKDKP